MSIQMRKTSEVVLNRMNEMKVEHFNLLLVQIQKANSVFSKSDVSNLLRKEFEAFSKEVNEEFTDPEAIDFADMYLPSFKLQMIGGHQIRNQVVEILGDKLQ